MCRFLPEDSAIEVYDTRKKVSDLDEDALRFALKVSSDSAAKITEVLEILNYLWLVFFNFRRQWTLLVAEPFLDAYGADDFCTVLSLVLHEQESTLRELTGRISLLAELGSIPEPPVVEEAEVFWVMRYPGELHAPLRLLAKADPQAEQTAARVLRRDFPDEEAIKNGTGSDRRTDEGRSGGATLGHGAKGSIAPRTVVRPSRCE